MKILCHFILVSSIVLANAEAELPTTVVEELEAEHRSAKPEPFLEKLAAAIFGSNDKNTQHTVIRVALRLSYFQAHLTTYTTNH